MEFSFSFRRSQKLPAHAISLRSEHTQSVESTDAMWEVRAASS
jgi:hypothetical protein